MNIENIEKQLAKAAKDANAGEWKRDGNSRWSNICGGCQCRVTFKIVDGKAVVTNEIECLGMEGYCLKDRVERIKLT